MAYALIAITLVMVAFLIIGLIVDIRGHRAHKREAPAQSRPSSGSDAPPAYRRGGDDDGDSSDGDGDGGD